MLNKESPYVVDERKEEKEQKKKKKKKRQINLLQSNRSTKTNYFTNPIKWQSGGRRTGDSANNGWPRLETCVVCRAAEAGYMG